MKRWVGGSAVLLLLVPGLPVRACLNDRYTDLAEKEFRSRYQRPAPTTPPIDVRNPLIGGINLWGASALTVGTLLLITGIRRQWRQEERP